MLIEEIKISQVLTESEKKVLLMSINEALAVNKEVEDTVMRIYDIFRHKMDDMEWRKGDDGTFSYKKVVFEENVFNQPFNVTFSFNCINAYKPEFYEALEKRFSIGNGSILGAKKIVATAGFISGSPKDSVMPVIQHELEHFYQMTRKQSGNLRTNGLGRKSSQIYWRATNILKGGGFSEEEFNVAFLIYTHADFEEDAFVNQMYRELKDSSGIGADEIKKTTAFEYYKIGARNLKLISGDRKKYEPIINAFGMGYNDFVSVYSKLNKRFIEKIGRVLVKYNDELMETSIIEFFDLHDGGKHII